MPCQAFAPFWGATFQSRGLNSRRPQAMSLQGAARQLCETYSAAHRMAWGEVHGVNRLSALHSLRNANAQTICSAAHRQSLNHTLFSPHKVRTPSSGPLRLCLHRNAGLIFGLRGSSTASNSAHLHGSIQRGTPSFGQPWLGRIVLKIGYSKAGNKAHQGVSKKVRTAVSHLRQGNRDSRVTASMPSWQTERPFRKALKE